MCTFQLPHPSEEATKDVRDRHVIVKPQVQWALRRNHTAVRDMALGSDGTIVICTYSGHVFVRQRVKAGAGQLKFRRIPYLQRVVKVATNESGAFAAVRVDARPTAIALSGKTLEEDMFLLQPHFRRFENQMSAEDFRRPTANQADEDDDESTDSVARDTAVAVAMCQILNRWQASSAESLFAWSEALLGSDLHILVGEYAIPAHSVILSLRSPVLARILKGTKVAGFAVRRDKGDIVLEMDACHPMVAMLLLQYLYSDEVAAIWDSRVSYILTSRFAELKLPIAEIKADLRRIAETLELAPLLPVLALGSKASVGSKTLAADLAAFHVSTLTPPSPKCDTLIVLADREVAAHSTLLRARCPFFESMFADRDWTLERREHGEHDGKVVIQMDHLRWRPMNLVLKYMHEGVEDDLFDYVHQETLDEVLDFVFEVLAAATELLMDRLVLVCSRVIARHCNPYNAAALATEASFYQASVLKRSIFDYIASCMETMLESGLLDDMDDEVLRDLSDVIAAKQSDRAVIPRSAILVSEAMAKNRDWLALQDIPTPRVRAPQKWKPRSPLLVPHDHGRRSPGSPLATPDLKPLQPTSAVDEIFSMDEETPTTPATPTHVNGHGDKGRPMTPLSLGSAKTPVWKSRTVQSEKVDLRNIMAETAAANGPRSSTSGRPVPGSGSPLLSATRTIPGGSPVAGSPVLGPQRTLPGAAGSLGTPGPWRSVEQRKTSLTSVQAQEASSSSPASILNRPAGSQAGPAPQRAGAAKVITPVKLTPSASTPRRTGATGPAWSTPTTYAPPPPPPVSTSPQVPTQSFSLLAIQQQERDAAARFTQKSVKSLAEIQSEERQAKAARAEEEEFMRWWQEEEARVAAAQGSSGNASAANGAGRGRGRGQQKRVPHRGRGRGRGDGRQAEGKENSEGVSNKEASTTATNGGGQASGGAGGGPGGGGGAGGGGRGRGTRGAGRSSKQDKDKGK